MQPLRVFLCLHLAITPSLSSICVSQGYAEGAHHMASYCTTDVMLCCCCFCFHCFCLTPLLRYPRQHCHPTIQNKPLITSSGSTTSGTRTCISDPKGLSHLILIAWHQHQTCCLHLLRLQLKGLSSKPLWHVQRIQI